MERSEPTRTEPARPAAAGGYAVWHGWRLLLQDLALHPANVLRRAQLPGDLFARDSASLDTPQYFKLWTALEAEAETGDRADPAALPLRIAQAMSADWFEPALFAALCSADLNAALTRIAKYKRLVAPMALQVDTTPQHTRLTLAWLDKTLPPPPVLVAFELVFFVQLARLATRSPVQPIGLVCPPPLGHETQYEAYFGCKVTAGAVPTVIFRAEDANRPFLTANHGMWSFFEPALRKRLHDLDRQATMTERVRSALLEALPAGDLAMDTICRKLGVSSRTMQRRLRDESGSFQRTLDQVRESLAQHYLAHSAMTGAEISFLLGFEDPNSFVRAFQAWTGTTPQTARAARTPQNL
jgi:AraC-like DNA-binding protein